MIRSGLMFDDFTACDSPIEALFQLGMASLSGKDRLEWSNAKAEKTLREYIGDGVVVGSQIWMMAWRLDFLFVCGNQVLGVECDGRDFHHGSPTRQAEDRVRDIRLSSGRGLLMLRLTGSEIYRNPLGVVNECMEHLGRPHIARDGKVITDVHYDLLEMPLRRRQLAEAARALTPPGSGLVSTTPNKRLSPLTQTMNKVAEEGWTPIGDLVASPKDRGNG